MPKSMSTKQNKAKRIVSGIVSVLLVLSVCFCLLVSVQILTDGYVSFFGHSFFRVATGSMEPAIPVGTIIITHEEFDDIEEGDIISFVSQEGTTKGKVITHRVMDIIFSEKGSKLLQTKGDANLSIDSSYVGKDNYIGTVVWQSSESNIMKLFAVITNKFGFVFLIAMPILIVAAVILSSCVSRMKKDVMEAMDTLAAVEKKEKEVHEETEEEMRERIKKELLEEMGQSEQFNAEP